MANKPILVVILILLLLVVGVVASIGPRFPFQPSSTSAPEGHVASTVTSTTTYTESYTQSASPAPVPAFIDAAMIYRDSSESVVTVDGFLSEILSTPFGQFTRISEVFGSGFVMQHDDESYVITNFHVIDGVSNMTVVFWNGDAYPGSVLGRDPYSDLAVITVPSASPSDLHPLNLSSSSFLHVGDPVAAIGNPFGLSGSLSVGVVSQLGRTITEASAANYSIADVIQFSAPINPGNSGGPLFDSNGRVIGLTTATLSGSQGVGFAIPSDAVAREIASLIATGTYSSHPSLGIATSDMNYQVAVANGNNVTYGVLVETAAAGGPASIAGVQGGARQAIVGGQPYMLGGDVIVSINGTRIINTDALASYLEEKATPGRVVILGIARGTTLLSIPITVGSLSSPLPAAG